MGVFQSSQEEAEQMMAGYEAMLNEVGGTYEGDGPTFTKSASREREDTVGSSEDEVARETMHSGSDDPSSAQTMKSCDLAAASGDNEAKMQHRCSGDVEEGEVSDSSEEVSRTSSQETSEVVVSSLC